MCVLSHFSCVWLFVTLWIVVCKGPLSTGFSRQEYLSGLLCPPPGNLPKPGIKPASRLAPALQADFSPLSHWRSPYVCVCMYIYKICGKSSACNAGDTGLIPVLGRSPTEGNANPFQYSCLENSMDRGAWQATVHGIARVGHNLTSKPPPHTYIHTYAYIQIHTYLHISTYIKCDIKTVLPHSFIYILLEAKPRLWKVCLN